MKFPWHSDKAKTAGRNYTSSATVDSLVMPGVKFVIAKMSFGRRMDLMLRVRELARRAEFLAASASPGDKMDAALMQAEIERLYVMWGIQSVAGLTVDSRAAGAEALTEAGPEGLFREALGAVRRETGLSEEERKNF